MFFNGETCAVTLGYDTAPERAPPWVLPSASFSPSDSTVERLALAPRVSENDIQFTEISSLHRRHCQHEVIAEMDAPCPHPLSHHICPPPLSHLSMRQQLTADRYGEQELVMKECHHEIEVTVVKGLRDGGKGNVLTVNYSRCSCFPSEASIRAGCYISPTWLSNPLTHINEMHLSAPFSKLKLHAICNMLYFCCLV